MTPPQSYSWLNVLPIIGPAGVAVLFYFIRIERFIAEIKRDICWIKKYIKICQQSSGENTN